MTYHRDGSPFSMTPGLAYPNILNYGWLSGSVPYATGDGSGWEMFKELADTFLVWITRGHHTCEFCGWEHRDNGNGEIWLRLGKQTLRFPPLIWHYIKEHRYAPPISVMSAVRGKEYVAYSDDEIDQELRLNADTCIFVPYVRRVAKWKEERYKHLMAFQKANYPKWCFSSCYIRDGFYVAEVNPRLELIDIHFEADPENYPDSITITTVVGPTPASGG